MWKTTDKGIGICDLCSLFNFLLRQLLAIARAAVADPPVLILDEATSSVDTRTEALIERGMDQLMEGRTVFVIAHRLSTVRNSNAIMVLEQGKIVERGDHDDLLEQKGKYYQLYHGCPSDKGIFRNRRCKIKKNLSLTQTYRDTADNIFPSALKERRDQVRDCH